MAMTYGDATYGNALRRLVTDPSSFQGTPGFDFALNTAMDNVGRQAAARGMNTSGNVMGDLTRTATGLASQNFMDYMKTLGGLTGQEQQYDLGMGANANAATRNANDLTLGQEQNRNVATRNANDLTLGLGRNSLDAENNRNNYNLGMYRATNEYDLGLGANQNNANRNLFDYNLGQQRNANEATNNQNQFNLGMFNANTNRGNSLADIYFRRQAQFPHTFNTPNGQITTNPRFY